MKLLELSRPRVGRTDHPRHPGAGNPFWRSTMDKPGNHFLPRGHQPGAADRMRELLARSVHDHVADQRSTADTLEDIRQRMEGLEWLVKDVREREMPGLAARLDE